MLFCLTAEYTPHALNAMRENPNTNRQAAVEQLLAAAGGKLVSMYGRTSNGPGVMVIFDVTDPAMAPAGDRRRRVRRYRSECPTDTALHDGGDCWHPPEGRANTWRL